MQVKWTDAQKKAVFGEKANCLVSAAAGSGKTQVLTGRILNRIVQDKIDINRILVVTFTKAAASEMRARIAEGLSEALAKDPENVHLQRQISLVSMADITTMDAFCLKLLRAHFIEAGVDAAFRVADATECKLMRAEAAEAALEELYKEGDADFLTFANCYSDLKDDSVLCDLTISLYEFAASMPDPDAWIREKADLYDVRDTESYEESIYCKQICAFVLREINALSDCCREASQVFADAESYRTVFTEDAVALSAICQKGTSWNMLKYAIDDFAWPRRGKEENKELAEAAENTRKSIKKQAEAVFAKIAYDAEACAVIMQNAAPHVRALCALTECFARLYAAAKREKNILDYSDLEHAAISLLSEKTEEGVIPSAVACTLRDGYDEIYIDEYQDSNDVQELLFTLLSGESIGKPNMFMVGDMKQSIYGFRKTSPELFIRKNESYQEDGPCRRISLSQNFRSRPEILGFVNLVFEQIMSQEVGGIAYTDREKLYPAAPYPESVEKMVEINIVDTDGGGTRRLEEEAFLIVQKIKDALRTNVYDLKKGAYRKAQYGDITVIMRSAKDMAVPLRKACEAEDIPLYCDVGGGYFSTVEVSVFLSLLKSIDNPQDDIPLLSCMRAPFFAFTEDELAQIRLRDRKHLFYYAVLETAKEENALGTKCKDFLKKLRRWRRKAAFLPTDTLVLTLFEETGYLRFLDGCEGGESKRANLELLFEKAHRFEQTAFRGLFHFLRFVERLSAGTDGDSEAKLVGGENVVRLMSIHKSKGLEFPIVILAGAGKQYNKKSVQGDFLFDKDLGIGISCVEEKRKIKYDTPAKTAIYFKKNVEERGEELRVLYVALTRAKERLIITAAGDAESILESWKGDLSASAVLHAESPLVLLGRAIADTDTVSVHLHNPYAVNHMTENKIEIPSPLKPDDAVSAILGYQYPDADGQKLPSKISVTEYKRLKEETDKITLPLYKSTILKKPRFRSMEGNIRGADFGTLMHFVMQKFPYETVKTRAEIQSFVDSLVSKNILSETQGAAVDVEKLYLFWNGELGDRIRRADRVYRETPFTQTVPASLLTNNPAHKGERIVIQGIIDCFFFEKDGIVLVDYKTDKPAPENVILARYKTQLECYAMALQQKYFSEISQKVIYLFANNGIIEVR